MNAEHQVISDSPEYRSSDLRCQAIPEPPLFGRLIFHLLPLRRGTIMRNIRRAFDGRLTDSQTVRLAQAAYGHMARSIAEVLASSMMPAGEGDRRVRVENVEAALRAASKGNGVLILTGHLGNWELALPAAIAAFPEWQGRIHIVRKTLPWPFDTMLRRRFDRAGIIVIPSRGAARSVVRVLRRGDAVIFVMDQHAGGSDGIVAEFMGAPAYTFRSLAVLALATGALVVPGSTYRESDGRHVVRFEEALPTIRTGHLENDILLNTRMYNRTLEELIYRHPEQWFWMHRRWKDAHGRPL
jgi:KDO2-lipid IV(A) lauroyltransferase